MLYKLIPKCATKWYHEGCLLKNSSSAKNYYSPKKFNIRGKTSSMVPMASIVPHLPANTGRSPAFWYPNTIFSKNSFPIFSHLSQAVSKVRASDNSTGIFMYTILSGIIALTASILIASTLSIPRP